MLCAIFRNKWHICDFSSIFISCQLQVLTFHRQYDLFFYRHMVTLENKNLHTWIVLNAWESSSLIMNVSSLIMDVSSIAWSQTKILNRAASCAGDKLQKTLLKISSVISNSSSLKCKKKIKITKKSRHIL